TTLAALLFSSLGVAIAINVLADPLAGLLDRLAFSRSPDLRAEQDGDDHRADEGAQHVLAQRLAFVERVPDRDGDTEQRHV
ncbi:hypothetical protein C6A85_10415, partial [Mycobacterium sp. ITM-2017-0098]